MPKFRVLSGLEVIKIFESFGFLVVSQKGSHVKLQRQLSGNFQETLVIPFHKELDRGTLQAIYRQALRFIPQKDLLDCFCRE